MMGGTVIAFLGGLLYWWPKMTGKMHDERKAKIGFVFVFVGFNLTFMPQFIMGSRGMPRRYYDYLPQFEPFHKASTIGRGSSASGLVPHGLHAARGALEGQEGAAQPVGLGRLRVDDGHAPVPSRTSTRRPIITRGPYDYHLATPEELYDGLGRGRPTRPARRTRRTRT